MLTTNLLGDIYIYKMLYIYICDVFHYFDGGKELDMETGSGKERKRNCGE
jgi:hypothetical protein